MALIIYLSVCTLVVSCIGVWGLIQLKKSEKAFHG